MLSREARHVETMRDAIEIADSQVPWADCEATVKAHEVRQVTPTELRFLTIL